MAADIDIVWPQNDFNNVNNKEQMLVRWRNNQ